MYRGDGAMTRDLAHVEAENVEPHLPPRPEGKEALVKEARGDAEGREQVEDADAVEPRSNVAMCRGTDPARLST